MTDPIIEYKADELSYHIRMLENWLGTLGEGDESRGQQIVLHYTVVAAYGIIEFEMKRILNSLEQQNVSMNLARYRSKVSKKYQWDFEVICEYLSMANNTLSEEVISRVDTQQQESITSLKGERNSVAHGDYFHSDFGEIEAQFLNSIAALHTISDIVQEANCCT